MTTFQEWRNQFHTTHNTGIPEGHLEAQQMGARRMLRNELDNERRLIRWMQRHVTPSEQSCADRGSEDCALDHVPWEPEGDGDYTVWPRDVLPLT